MKNSAKIYQLVLWSILLFSSFAGAGGNSIDDVSKEFSSIYYKLSKLASSSVSSMSVDSARMLFLEVQNRIKGVHTILRINSTGMVINEISLTGTAKPMRSVADQKWFVEVRENNRAYFGTSRESGGANPLLFWAWPVQTASGVFGGVLSVKVDASPVCSEICKDHSVHFAAFYNEILLFRCGNDRYMFTKEANLTLPDSSRIILRSGDAAAGNRAREYSAKKLESESTAQSGSVPSDQEIEEKKTRESGSEVETNEGVVKEKEKTVQTVDYVDKKGKKGLNFFTYIVLFGVIISGTLLIKAILKKNTVSVPQPVPEKYEQCDKTDDALTTDTSGAAQRTGDTHHNPVEQESASCTVANENDKGNDAAHVEDVNDVTEHHLARETCEKIKAIISDSAAASDAISMSSPEILMTDDTLRKELYREIHGQIIHWVTCESSRLSQSLQELSDRVGKLENVNDPEVMRIRNEARRISKEIASFKDNATAQGPDGTGV